MESVGHKRVGCTKICFCSPSPSAICGHVRGIAYACRYNPLDEAGVKAVVDTVKYDLPLKALKLGWCKVGNKAGAEHVAQLLAFNETLEVCFLW